MRITILHFDGCPDRKLADERVQSVLRGLARDDVALACCIILQKQTQYRRAAPIQDARATFAARFGTP
jgi:hypothetical protein